MSALIKMTTDQVVVDPGATVTLTLDVTNPGAEADRYELDVQGLDPGWVAIPQPTFELTPGEQSTARVFFKPPRESESVAGSYPFVVRVRSLNTGEERSQQGVLTIKAFHHLTSDLSPKKLSVGGVGPDGISYRFSVTNLGNSDEVLQVTPADPDNELAFESEAEQITASPGQTLSIGLQAFPKVGRPFSSTRLHAFDVTARSVANPTVATAARATVERRPLISPGFFAAFITIVALIAAWVYLIPKPPQIRAASLDMQQALPGQAVRVTWDAMNADFVQLKVGDVILGERLQPKASFDWTPTSAGNYQFEVTPVNGSWRGDPFRLDLRVTEPERSPAPEILEFSVTPTTVKKGEAVRVRYRLSESVTEAVLTPANERLEITTNEITVPVMAAAGRYEWTLTAKNKDGLSTQRIVRVEVIDPPLATIVSFKASETEVEPGATVTLEWLVTRAVQVTLSVNGQSTPHGSQGTFAAVIDKDTTFTLTAVDEEGRKAEQKVTVKVKQTAPVPDEPNTRPAVPRNDPGTATVTPSGERAAPPRTPESGPR